MAIGLRGGPGRAPLPPPRAGRRGSGGEGGGGGGGGHGHDVGGVGGQLDDDGQGGAAADGGGDGGGGAGVGPELQAVLHVRTGDVDLDAANAGDAVQAAGQLGVVGD